MGSSVLVSVMFTDLVGSTETAARLGAAGAEELRQEHFAVLDEAVARHGGTVVKNLGDGIMAIFPTASAALDGAVAVQQAVDSRNRWARHPTDVRVGVSVGEAVSDEGDYFGAPVVEAARLCSLAEGGDILASELLCLLAAHADIETESVGPLLLKGLAEPVAARRVRWARTAAGTAGLLPERLDEPVTFGFVGRGTERARLEAALRRCATEGGQRGMILAGPSGVGKTTLASELARWALGMSATVLYGRCDEQVDLPYQPFAQALADYVHAAPDAVLAAHVQRHGAVLVPMLPELAERVPVGPVPASADLESDRYLLYAAVVGLLSAASARQPVLMVLDDLHWADGQTLALFHYLMQSKAALRLLALATARNDPGARPLADLVADPGVEVVTLSGLERDEVLELMENAAGHELDQEGQALARTLYDETGGNPLFVGEILIHLAETGVIGQGPDGRWTARVGLDAIRLPDSVREVIRSRTRHLSAAGFGALTVAAVIGREFDLDLVARAEGIGEGQVLDALEEAERAAIVREVPGRVGRFTFSHGLFQQAIYEDLTTTRRQRTHLRLAQVLRDECGDDPGERIGELARHWCAAATPETAGVAVDYARRAGDRALAQLAPDEAVRWYAEAMLMDPGAPDDVRCRLLIGLGDAQRQSGRPGYRQTLLEAAERARRLGDADLLVRSALANNRGFVSVAGRVDEERVEVLEAAIGAVGPADSAERARLLALLANELTYDGFPDRRRAVSDEALAVARRLGDPATTVHVLNLRFNAIWMPSTLAERLSLTAEAMQVAAQTGDRVARFWAAKARADTALEAGDLAEADRCLDVLSEVAESVGQPVLRWQHAVQRTWRVLLGGDLAAAESLASQAWELGEASRQPDASALFGAQLVSLRWFQGRIGELNELIARTVDENPGIAAMRAALVLVHADGDDVDPVRDALLTAIEKSGLPVEDPTWITAMACYAEAAAMVAEPGPAAELYERLRPWRDHVVTNGTTCEGPVAHYLAQLASVLGRPDEAEALFRLAAGANERVGCPFFTARTSLSWGRLLLAGGPDQAERGRRLVQEALELSRAHGFGTVERRAGALLLPAGL